MALKLGSTGSALRVGSTTAKYARVGTTLKAVAPPLDIVGSAAAAYSLRKLSYAYTGPVVEVRRSSDDTTADFTADEVEDGTLAAWVGAGNDGFVATWYDQSGNSRDATQATAGSQPQIVDNGSVVTEGGKPAILFDDSDDKLKASFSLTPQPNVIFSVLTSNATEGETPTHIAYDDDSGDARNTYDANGDAFAGSATNGSPLPAGQQAVASIIYDGASSFIYRNGALDAAGDVGTQGLSGLTIGSRFDGTLPWDGTIQEILVYPYELRTLQYRIEGNLCWHYGLQNKLPYNHAEVRPQTLPTDTDVLAFAAASGAVSIPDLLKIEDLVAYLKAQSLWDYARFYPMKSAQNAGSGATVYGLGGLTANNMTLVNSPTWGSDGVTFAAASSQYGTISDFLSGGVLGAFWRGTNTQSNSPCLCQYDFGTNNRAWGLVHNNSGVFSARRSENGGDYEEYSDGVFPASEATIAAYWAYGTPAVLEVDGVAVPATLGGTAVNSIKNAGAAITLGAFLNSGSPAAGYYMSGTVVLAGVIETALTTTQRETIADLINAL